MYEELLKYAVESGCKAVLNEPMKRHISFRLGGEAKAFAEPDNGEKLAAMLKYADENHIRRAVIGNGTNLIVADGGFDGLVIHLGENFGKTVLMGDDEIFCEAGANLMKVCSFALENSLSGLEFAYGIPGSAGGAAFMNAGAYGGEMKDVIYKCTHIDDKYRLGEFEGEDLKFSYRHSIYSENGFTVTGIYMKLKHSSKSEIKAKMDDVYARRKEKQPLEYPSAGSTFKRPQGYFAAQLIDECGLRGKTIGGAQVSEKHAGFIINRGSAKCEDVLNLCDYVSGKVYEKFGVNLVKEVRVLK